MANRTTVTEFLAVICIFSVFLDRAIRGVFAFDLYYHYPIFLLFLISLVIVKGQVAVPPKWFLQGIAVIFACSLLILVTNGMLGFEFWKQVFGILFTALVYYNVLFVLNFDLTRIFRYYLKFAFWVALAGIVNNALHLSGIHLTSYFKAGVLFRESSIMGEPFYLALALTPAVAYYLFFLKRSWQREKAAFLSIFICYLLTFSSIAVAGVAISALLALYFNDFFNLRKNRLILAPVLIVPIVLLVNFFIDNVNLINARFTDTTKLFFASGLQASEAERSNSSTFALYSNYVIARDSFLEDPLFGSGLGSHPLIYEKTFLKYFPSFYLNMYGAQNQQDANSKFLRLMSETGAVGLLLFMFIFVRFFAPKKHLQTDALRELGAINYAVFVYILLCLIRNGNYINVGFFLFLFMYYVTWKQVRDRAGWQATTPSLQD